MSSQGLDRVGPFDYYGHVVEGRVRSGNVSASGPALVSNASWYLCIDGEDLAVIREARVDDIESEVRRLLIRAADAFLNPAPELERDAQPDPTAEPG